MSEKRYYWLKLKEDFFDDETIQYIEEQENGYRYSNFYLKLCLRSLRSNGHLIRIVGDTFIPYDVKSLARLTGVDSDTVCRAMDILQAVGCVKIMESGEIHISQLKEMVGTETDKARIMREIRVRKKINGNNVTPALPECYPDVTQSIEYTDRKERTDIENICEEPLQVSPPEPEEPPVISFILNDKSRYPIRQAQVDEWSGLYPAVDIMQELRKMAGWLDANPSKRKTKRGILRFVNGWLAREQDKGGKKVENNGRNAAGTDEEHPGSGETYGKYGIWL